MQEKEHGKRLEMDMPGSDVWSFLTLILRFIYIDFTNRYSCYEFT